MAKHNDTQLDKLHRVAWAAGNLLNHRDHLGKDYETAYNFVFDPPGSFDWELLRTMLDDAQCTHLWRSDDAPRYHGDACGKEPTECCQPFEDCPACDPNKPA